MNTEKLFNEKTKKDKMMETRAKELKALRERLMAGTRDSVMDSFDELNHRKVKKTEVDVRSENAKKFILSYHSFISPLCNVYQIIEFRIFRAF